jgi:hypothetical protein
MTTKQDNQTRREAALARGKEFLAAGERQRKAQPAERTQSVRLLLTLDDYDRALMEVKQQRDEAVAALRDLLTAAEIVDGCERPDDLDIEHLQAQFQRSHQAIARIEGHQTK